MRIGIAFLVLLVVASGMFNTVNSEIFARVLFSRNFAYAKFRENINPREMAKSLCLLLI